MLTKEEYQRDYIRMMDSLRVEGSTYKGKLGCEGVDCKDCPFGDNGYCRSGDGSKVFEFIEIVEKWSKEHPIVTMRDKFIEVWGVEPKNPTIHYQLCPLLFGLEKEHHDCDESNCIECKDNFWNSEYKSPVKENIDG